MIKCISCGYEGVYTGIKCPECGAEYKLDDNEINQLLEDARTAKKNKEYETAVECYRMLADFGVTEGEREFARILERGDLIDRNLDGAMHYFYSAALKNDAYSAYRYSKLSSRGSEISARFWLAYSAMLGCVEAYPDLAKSLSEEGRDSEANYYFSLAAACDDTDSIVTLAKRYYEGIGTDCAPQYAKWYMDKLSIPPIHAIKLAYKLRGVKAEEPPALSKEGIPQSLKSLASTAKHYGFDTAQVRLLELLRDLGDMEATTALGILYAKGVGCEASAEKAVEALHLAAANGRADAYKFLGDMYLAGIGVTANGETAMKYYESSAKLGLNNAYELMGDMYESGELVKRDIAKAVKLYDLAANCGSETARSKSEEIKQERLALYEDAIEKRQSAPEEAFRAVAISTAMGYLPSYTKLAEYFLLGVGTEIDRQRAFYWYSEAAALGDKEALYYLGLCHSRGIGTPLDYKKATEILIRSHRNGTPGAEEELIRIKEAKKKKLSSQLFSSAMRLLYQKKFEPAKQILDVCAELQVPRAIYTLGCLYEFGMGVNTDRDLAFELYEKSYSLKFRDPRQVYKLRILRMVK